MIILLLKEFCELACFMSSGSFKVTMTISSMLDDCINPYHFHFEISYDEEKKKRSCMKIHQKTKTKPPTLGVETRESRTHRQIEIMNGIEKECCAVLC